MAGDERGFKAAALHLPEARLLENGREFFAPIGEEVAVGVCRELAVGVLLGRAQLGVAGQRVFDVIAVRRRHDEPPSGL